LSKKTLIWGGFALLPVCLVLLVTIGPADISVRETLSVILSKMGLPFSKAADSSHSIIWGLRLPRLLTAALVGGGLAVCGAVLQAFFRNPMADPYIIGISSGAALGTALSYVTGVVAIFLGMPFFSFLFALLAVYLVYRLGAAGGSLSNNTLLLAGVAMASFLSAVISLIMVFNVNKIPNMYIWLLGGLTGSSWKGLYIIAPLVLGGSALLFLLAPYLNAMLFGDDTAHNLGVPVKTVKKLLLVLVALIVAVCVAYCGPIGFVGLIIPHGVRFFTGPGHRRLLPASFWAGGVFLMLTDTLARTALSPREIPVGVICALFGAPFFIFLLCRRKAGN